jgi:hypothetical protein
MSIRENSHQQQNTQKLSLPDPKTLLQCAKLSIKLSKPLCFYFYIDSCKGDCKIVSTDGEKILYKNGDEHTSPIKNTYKVGNEYIIVTENTIYIVSANTKIQ